MSMFKKRSGSQATRKSAPPASAPRATVPQTTSPQAVAPPASPASPEDIPDELIAARAYEKWQRRGSPAGQDGSHDWHAARVELEQERLGWAAPTEDDRA
jgi:hypothetical protein